MFLAQATLVSFFFLLRVQLEDSFVFFGHNET